MKTLNTIALLASLALGFAASPASAQILLANINTTGQTYSGAAVTGSAGDFWNNDTNTSLVNLKGLDGTTATGLTVQFGGLPNVYNPSSTPSPVFTATKIWANSPDANFPEGIATTNGSHVLTFTGFTIGTLYTFDVLNATDTTGRSTTSTLTGATTVTGVNVMKTADTTWVQNDEWVSLTAAPDINGDFTLNFTPTPGTPEGDLNGIQILQAASTSAPEPSTYALMLGGVALLVLVRARRVANI